MLKRPPFDLAVFVNCPFDEPFKPLLDAILFAIHDCGFAARTALEESGSGETRLDKLVRVIGECRFSIHDISRTETTQSSPLPRFNMPFECGLALGAIRYRRPLRSGSRDFLLMAAEDFQDKRTLSDLAGQDASYHGNDPRRLIKATRRFLASKASEVLAAGAVVRGDSSITARLSRFSEDLPAMAASVNISAAEIRSFDYLPEWLGFATRWQATNP